MKPIATIAVLSLVVVSLSVAGCTVNFNAPAPTATPTATPGTIAQIVSSDGSLSSFTEFLNKANLTGVLNGPGRIRPCDLSHARRTFQCMSLVSRVVIRKVAIADS